MALKSYFDELTSSSSWLLGVLLVIVLFLLCLVGILIARFSWHQKRMPIFYCCGADGGYHHFNNQYIVRLSYERDPLRFGHDRDCQLWIEFWQEKDFSFIVPMFIDKFYEFRRKPTTVVLLRTKEAVVNLRCANITLKCTDSCRANGGGKLQGEQLVEQLQMVSLNVQKVPSKLMWAIKIAPSGDPKGLSKATMPKPLYIEQGRFYPFAVEQLQAIDYHPIRHAICCPSDSWIVFNFFTICAIFLLVAAFQIRYFSPNTSLLAFGAIVVCCTSISGAVFFISAYYLFVTWVQDAMYIASTGRSLGGRLLHFGTLLVMIFLGLAGALSSMTMLHSQQSLLSNTHQNTSYRGLCISLISITVFFILETLVCLFDSKTSRLGNVFGYSKNPQVCPQVKIEKLNTKETLSALTK